MSNKIVSLFLKLANIQLAIESEQKRRMPDWSRLFRLKRLRLMVKDRLSAMTASHERPRMAYARARNRNGRTA